MGMTKAQRSGEYYKTQAAAWKTIAASKKTDGNAWMNYYDAARYSNMFNKGEDNDLKKIVAAINQNIPNSFEANYLTFALNPWEKKSFQYLEKAYAIQPENPRTYQAFINTYLIADDNSKYNEFCKKHYYSVDNSPGLLSWNYNALVNLEPNAILFTEGDNDTYPAWIIQEAKGFRKDVFVINTNLFMDDNYRNLILSKLKTPKFTSSVEQLGLLAYRQAIIDHILKHSNRPVYFGIGTRKNMRDKYVDNLHLVGLSFKHTADNFDHIAILRKSYENDFLLDYIKMPMLEDPHQVELDRYSRSYLPSLIKLYEHYKQSGELLKAGTIKELTLLIGEKSNTLEETKKTLAKY